MVISNQNNNQIIVVEDNNVKNGNNENGENHIDFNEETFVPTKEWQTIKLSQAIPKGLHVRLNMQTGEREAKLLKEPNQPNENHVLTKEFEEALKNLNDEFKNKDAESDKDEHTKNKFKSYEKIKEEMADLNLNIKTDYEILRELIAKLNEELEKPEKLTILKDLEFYVHQVSQHFTTLKNIIN